MVIHCLKVISCCANSSNWQFVFRCKTWRDIWSRCGVGFRIKIRSQHISISIALCLSQAPRRQLNPGDHLIKTIWDNKIYVPWTSNLKQCCATIALETINIVVGTASRCDRLVLINQYTLLQILFAEFVPAQGKTVAVSTKFIASDHRARTSVIKNENTKVSKCKKKTAKSATT